MSLVPKISLINTEAGVKIVDRQFPQRRTVAVKLDSLSSSRFLGIIWLLLAAPSLFGCDTKIGIELVKANNDRPTFRVTGDEAVSWIWMHGPYSSEPTTGEQPILWRIVPSHSKPLPKEIPPIQYGNVPPGWEQTIPKGAVPSLVDGGLYGVTVVTVRNRSDGFLFMVENGKAVEYKGTAGSKE